MATPEGALAYLLSQGMDEARARAIAPHVAAYAASVQILERSFGMRRDIEQAATVRESCAKQGELVSLIETNNAGPADE